MSDLHSVEEADDGIRLDRWFKRHFPQLPHALLQKHLRRKDIKLAGKKAAASDHVQAGQEIYISLHIFENFSGDKKRRRRPPVVSPQQAQQIRDWVIFENKHVIAINKPPGIAVQGGSGQTNHIDAMLTALAGDDGQRPKLVHRLDRDTSGVLLLAKNAKAADVLGKAFAGKKAEKIYWALVKGVPELAQGEINLPLAKDVRGKDSRMEKVGVDRQGKPAITRYRVLERLGKRLAWLELLPLTGRTHQLRVHMQAIGHPIIGDGKYGGQEAFVEGMDLARKMHLHARRSWDQTRLPVPGRCSGPYCSDV